MEQTQDPGIADHPQAWLFGVRFDLLTAEQQLDWIHSLLAGPPRSLHIAFANSEFVLEARRNARFRRYLNGCDLTMVDGIGVAHGLAQVNGIPRPQRLSGTVFVATLAREAAVMGATMFLFGSAPGVADRAAEGLQRRAPGLRIAGTADGFGDAAGVLDAVRATRPDILVVCLGVPRQEMWVEDHLPELDLRLVWGAGGALDFYSGDVPLAPDWVQRFGLEWLFRLVTNFSIARLRRQLRLVLFVGLVAEARLRRALGR